MEVLTLKLILLFLMGLIPIIFGLMPLKLYTHLIKSGNGQIGRNSTIAVSLISCYCGGVILGVCLLELLPEAKKVEGLTVVEQKTGWRSDFPYVEFLVGIGLFIVYLIEELIGKFFGLKHNEVDESAKEAFEKIENGLNEKKPCSILEANGDGFSQRSVTLIATSTATLNPVAEKELEEDRRKAMSNAITFVLALVVHTSLEGFAFGIQDNLMSIGSLFFGIITHKALVAFSVGMSLARALGHNKKIVILLVLVLATFSPIGGLIGIALQSSDSESTVKCVVTEILTCFSIGTFLYICFFEILAPERQAKHPKLFQWFACVSGFLSMAGFMALADA